MSATPHRERDLEAVRFQRSRGRSFTTLYFAQLTARQSTLELWYAEDAQLTVGDTPYVGTTAIFEQLVRFPQAGYNVNAIDVQSDIASSTLLRATGNLMLDGTPDARPFETSFTLNSSSMIADQTFQGI
ncbi:MULTISPECIES: ketosteroid isomerase family protein [unclassified Nocardia]|uniref:ketosteroid isomerase family protein n=1 Tax=unclassified Nocardia TaxID=2637762 RepID=UPI00342BFBB3